MVAIPQTTKNTHSFLPNSIRALLGSRQRLHCPAVVEADKGGVIDLWGGCGLDGRGVSVG
jgi:hypothetical protein